MPKKIAPLSDVQISKAKSQNKDYKLSDGGGLYLLITETGGKLWRLQYRFDGKQKLLALGQYPAVTLADARQRREDARKLLANGVDPGEVKKAQKETDKRQATTFKVVFLEWHAHKTPEWSANHAGRLLNRMEQDIFPFIGEKPIGEITTPELADLLQRIAIRTVETAHRLKMAIGQLFQYAVIKGMCINNPAASLRGVLPVRRHKHMAALTEPKDVAELMRAIEGFKGTFVVKCALQLSPMLFQRPGEIRQMLWADINIETGEWKYFVNKVERNHLVPLSRQAVEILQRLKPLTFNSMYVFPSIRSPLKPMSENTINAALKRLGFTSDEIVPHGFRAMARTLLHETLGFSPDAIEAQLSHAVPDRLGRAYNRTQFIEERKRMMQAWCDYLDGLKAGAKVIPLHKAA